MVIAVSASIAPVGASDHGPGHGPLDEQGGLLGLDQMIEAGAGARVKPDRWPWANVHRDAAGLAGRLFRFACEIGPTACLWPLWMDVAVKGRPGPGFARKGSWGWVQPTLIADRHKRCNAHGHRPLGPLAALIAGSRHR